MEHSGGDGHECGDAAHAGAIRAHGCSGKDGGKHEQRAQTVAEAEEAEGFGSGLGEGVLKQAEATPLGAQLNALIPKQGRALVYFWEILLSYRQPAFCAPRGQ